MEIKCENCSSIWLADFEVCTGSLAASLEECPLCSRKEEEKPEVKPVKVPVNPDLKERIKKEMMVKPSKKIKRSQFRYPSGLRNFCIKNIDKMSNQELVEAANKEFDLDMDYSKLVSYLNYNNIRRSEGISKSQTGKGEKDLQKLPPPDY